MFWRIMAMQVLMVLAIPQFLTPEVQGLEEARMQEAQRRALQYEKHLLIEDWNTYVLNMNACMKALVEEDIVDWKVYKRAKEAEKKMEKSPIWPFRDEK